MMMHVLLNRFRYLNTDTFLKAPSWDTYRLTVRRAQALTTSLGDKHVKESLNVCMPPSRPRSWYGRLCSIYHLLSTDGGIPIARHIVWTISTGWAVDWGVIIVWITHKICRRVCAGHGYHPLIPSLTDRMRHKQQSTYDKNSSCNQQLYLMQSAFISNLVGVVVNMMIQ